MLMTSCDAIAAGPPGVKLPVAALTGTTSTTVYQAASAISSTPKPASRSLSPLPQSTSFTQTTPSELPVASSNPDNPDQSVGDTGGDSGDSDSSGNGGSGSQGDAGSSDSSDASGSSGDVSNTGDGSDTGGNDSGTSSTGSGDNPQGGGESGDNTGNTHTTPSDVSVESSVTTGSYNSGQSGASGSNGDSGSQSGGESSTSDNGSGSQDGGEQASTGSTGSANSQSGGNSPETNVPASIAPFVVTVGGHTISGVVHGSTAAVVAGNTIVAGSSPSSAGGALVSIYPGASSIFVNGESHALPTAQASRPSAIAIATIGSHTVSASPGTPAVFYAGTTLSQDGAHATIDNTDIHVDASGLIIGGSSLVTLPTIDSPRFSATPIATIGSQTLSAISGGSEVYYADITLTQSGAHATIDNTDIYVGASGLVIGDSSTVALPILDSPQEHATPIATIGSQTISAIFGVSKMYYAGSTLTRNGAHVTIDNTDVYLDSSGLVVGGSSTVTIPELSPTSSTESFPEVTRLRTFTIGGQTLSADSTAVYVDASTLAIGRPAITRSGIPISLGLSDIVIASTTFTLPSVVLPSGTISGATETSEGLGAIILGAFGPLTSTASASGSSIAGSNTSNAVAFQGAAARPPQSNRLAMLGLLLVGGLFLFVNGL